MNGQKRLPVTPCCKGIVLFPVLWHMLRIPIPCPNPVNEFLRNPVSFNGKRMVGIGHVYVVDLFKKPLFCIGLHGQT